MKKHLVALSFVGLLLPSLVFAAGFAKQSIFLSKKSVTEGDTVRIHATVSNDSTTQFVGSVVIKDGTTKLGSTPITLAASAAQAISLSWTPSAGTHKITADLETTSGTIVEEDTASFTIAAKPKPQAALVLSSEQPASVDSSQAIQQQIGNLSPQVEQASQPLFTVIDGARSSVATVLDNQIANTQAKLTKTPKPGIVAGASTTADASISNPWGTGWFALYTAYLYILTILRWLVGNAGVFYPFLAVLFLYMLWRLYRRMSRPKWDR